MLSPEERRLIIGICLLLMLGAVVKSCRHRVTLENLPPDKQEKIEGLPEAARPATDERAD